MGSLRVLRQGHCRHPAYHDAGTRQKPRSSDVTPMLVIATRVAIGGLLIIAAAYDIRSFRIPNAIPLGLMLLFAGTWMLGVQDALSPHALSFGLASAGGIALFLANAWGGGDTKLASAMALFLTPSELMRFLLIAALAGGVVSLVIMARSRQRVPTANTETRVPYGIALAVGGLDWCLNG